MRRLSLLLAVAVLSTTVGCSMLPANKAKETSSLTITEGIEKVNFTVKQPTWLPFTPVQKGAHTDNPTGNLPQVELRYTGGDRYVIVTEYRNSTNPLSSAYPITDLKLEQGTPAKFMDNGTVKIIAWVDAGVFCQIAAGGNNQKSDAFTQDELVKIASSVK